MLDGQPRARRGAPLSVTRRRSPRRRREQEQSWLGRASPREDIISATWIRRLKVDRPQTCRRQLSVSNRGGKRRRNSQYRPTWGSRSSRLQKVCRSVAEGLELSTYTPSLGVIRTNKPCCAALVEPKAAPRLCGPRQRPAALACRLHGDVYDAAPAADETFMGQWFGEGGSRQTPPPWWELPLGLLLTLPWAVGLLLSLLSWVGAL